MTRVAVLTDIQANLDALEAVLDRIEEIEVDAVYCGGDIAGDGPHPAETCHLIADLGIPAVQGGDDRAVAEGAPEGAWARARLDPAAVAFLRDLPREIGFTICSSRVRLMHGLPVDGPGPDCDVLVVGASHVPLVERASAVLVVDCGSVGRPRDGDPRASFAVLEEHAGRVSARIERVAYDVATAAAAIRAAGLPEHMAEDLLRGA